MAISPDNTLITAPTASKLVTAAGTWSFGASTPGGFVIKLNGAQPGGNAAGNNMMVANSGKLYVLNDAGQSFVWNGTGFAAAGFPFPSRAPVLPDLVPSPAGTFGDATNVSTVTVNAKGLVTGASSVAISGLGGASAFYMPSSAADLQTTLQAALDNGKMLLTSPDMRLDVPDTINLTLQDVGGVPHGWAANNGVLNWTGNDPTKSVVKFTMAGSQNYNLLLNDIYIFGGWYTGLQCKTGLELSIDNSVGAVYQFKVNGFGAGFCSGSALWIEGGIYEGSVAFPMIKSCGDGIVCRMGGQEAGAPQGILSNVSVVHPNIRANAGWGIRGDGAKSVMVVGGGSFVSNAAGAIWSPQGFKKMEGFNVEACPGGIQMDGVSDAGVVAMNVDGSNTAGNMPRLITGAAAASVTAIGCTMYNGTIT